MTNQNYTASFFPKLILSALLLFLYPPPIKAQDTLVYANSDQFIEAGAFVDCYVDQTAGLSFDQIKALPDSVFKKTKAGIISFGNTKASIWAKLPIQNQTNDLLYITFAGNYLAIVDAYILDDSGVWRVRQGGTSRPSRNRDLQRGAVSYNLGQNPRMVYVNLRSSSPLTAQVSVSSLATLANIYHDRDLFLGICLGVLIAIGLYNLFLFFSVKEWLYLYYFAYILMSIGLIAEVITVGTTPQGIRLPFQESVMIAGVIFSMRFLNIRQKMPIVYKFYLGFIGIMLACILHNNVLRWQPWGNSFFQGSTIFFLLGLPVLGIITYRRGNKSALYYTIAWTVLIFSAIITTASGLGLVPVTYLTRSALVVGMCLENLLLAFALANRLKEYRNATEKAQALALLRLGENEALVKGQNRLLEEKVNERTTELENSLAVLKATQTQLIQSEKLASLGELTAGIAHEIQNPLNFVNNFSDLSVDLVKDLKDEMDVPLTPEGGIVIFPEGGIVISSKNKAYMDELFTDLSQNQEKISHHGKRASSIIKGMLGHSRASTGMKELTDINYLVDESLRLSYHGLRAKDKSFNATMEKHFETPLSKIAVIPQDLGRVVLNLINNAFYAVNQRQRQSSEGLKPSEAYTATVSISTQHIDNQIIIKIKDNGTGMPESIKAKIFQPFFTTKPTGEGTGLGLSLSYDIVTKGHGGALEVETTEGVGTEFIIRLPA